MRQEQSAHIDEQVRRATAPAPAAITRLSAPGARAVMFDEIVRSAGDGGTGLSRRPTPWRPLLVAAAAAVLATAGGGVWAVTSDDPARPSMARPTEAGLNLDRHTPSGTHFYQLLRPSGGAAVSRQPGTLEAAFTEATVTVVAEISAVGAGRAIHDLRFVDVELRVTEVLRGALRPELDGVVRVEFPAAFAPDPIEPVVARMRSDLPANPAVWLLRWEGEPPTTRKPGAPAADPTADRTRYRLVHPFCGVFVQGPDHVTAATAGSDPATGAQREGQELPLLSELADRARK